MKRICLLLIAALLLIFAAAGSVSASEPSQLLPPLAFWLGKDDNGKMVTIEEYDDIFLFYGSTKGTRPYTQTLYREALSVPQEGYSLVYHFTVEKGACRIDLIYDSINGTEQTLPLGELLAPARQKGDMGQGIYKGAIPAEELIPEGERGVFKGIRVYSIDGGILEIFRLELMSNQEVPPDVSEIESSSEEPSKEESSEESSDETTPVESTPEESSRGSIFLSRAEESLSPEDSKKTAYLVTLIVGISMAFTGFFAARMYRRGKMPK